MKIQVISTIILVVVRISTITYPILIVELTGKNSRISIMKPRKTKGYSSPLLMFLS